ncbi:universal stress protein [Streptomyces sp. 549]|uniref:universal stress protein n=1 Tax=Streptomyces sp. 549 TaxID=3049076 RepID=UPI0024C3B0C2|nr:universal stress protein [Streptomyces sp. 549]MDK1475467.1 universal stress protein [Streptomyces sp. 549]
MRDAEAPDEPPRHVLAATDLSARAGRAVRRAAMVAARHGARLTVLHVVPIDVDPDSAAFAQARLHDHVREQLDGLPQAGTGSGTHVPAELSASRSALDVLVRTGGVADVVLTEAGQRSVDLLVVGAHGSHGLLDALLGSTAENLVRASPVPVLVVRDAPADEYREVLLAVDGSDSGVGALRTGAALAPGARRTVVHVHVVPGEHLLRMRGVAEPQVAEYRQRNAHRVRERVEELMGQAGLTGPQRARVLVETGRPHDVLSQTAERLGADLTVVGTGAGSRLGYALLGSVAQHVVHGAAGDVLVVRSVPQHPPAAQAEAGAEPQAKAQAKPQAQAQAEAGEA